MIGLISANENPEVHRREGLELSTEGFSNLAQREGRTVAKPDASKRSKLQNHCSRASFSAELGNGQYFVTRLSINNSGGTTLVCRVCYLVVVHFIVGMRFQSSHARPSSLGFNVNVLGKRNLFLQYSNHRIRTSTMICRDSSVDVCTNTPLSHTIWNNLLLKTWTTVLLGKNFAKPREPLRESIQGSITE